MGLLIVFLILVQNSAVQQWAAKRTVDFLSRKLQVPVRIDHVEIGFSGRLRVSGLYVQGQRQDTLLYLGHLEAAVNPKALFSQRIEFSELALSGLTARVTREDTSFNFQFVLDAFGKGNEEAIGSKPSWDFSLDHLHLANAALLFSDRQAALQAQVRIGEFDARLSSMDIGHGTIDAKALQLANSRIHLLRLPAVKIKNTDTTAETPFHAVVSQLRLSQVHFSYEDQQDKRDLEARIASFALDRANLDVERQLAEFGSLSLDNSSLAWSFDGMRSDGSEQADDGVTTRGWMVRAGQINLHNNRVRVEDATAPRSPGLDFRHLDVTKLSLQTRKLRYASTQIEVELDSLRFAERSGFELDQLCGAFKYDSTFAGVRGLQLRSGATRLVSDLSLRYGSMDMLRTHPELLRLDANFSESTVAFNDLLLLVPQLDTLPYLHALRDATLEIHGGLKGSLQHLQASSLELRIPRQQLSLQLNGEGRDLNDLSKMYLDLSEFSMSGSGKTVRSVLPDTLLERFSLPEVFAIRGRFTGYPRNFNADVELSSDLGDVRVRSLMDPSAGNRKQPYTFFVSASNLELGHLLGQPSLGAASFTAEARGKGFDTATVHAEVKAGLMSAVVNNYTYTGLQLNARVDKRCITGQATLRDRNIDLTVDGKVNLDPSLSEYRITVDTKGADLKALKLSDDDLRLSGLFQSDLVVSAEGNPEGTAAIRRLRLLRNGQRYELDSLVLRANHEAGQSTLLVTSPMLNAGLRGTFHLPDLPAALVETFNSYYPIAHQPMPSHPKPQKLDFDLHLHDNNALIGQLLPKLEKLSPVTLTGNYDSESRTIIVNGRLEHIRYDGLQIDSLTLEIKGDGRQLSARLNAEELSTTVFLFHNLRCWADAGNNGIALGLGADQQDSSRITRLSARLTPAGRTTTLSLESTQYIYGERWIAEAGNRLVMTRNGLFADRFRLSRESSAIGCQSEGMQPAAPMDVSFENFDLGSLSRMIENNTALVRGIADGHVWIEHHESRFAFRSDLRLSGLMFRSVPVGDLRLRADNLVSASGYSLDLVLGGNGNDVRLDGIYSPVSQGTALNMDLDIRRLNLLSVEPFTFGQVTRMSGGLSGRVKVKGALQELAVNGQLLLDQAAFRPRLLDSYLTIPHGELQLTGQMVKIGQLQVYDSLGNAAKVKGAVVFNNLKHPQLDLHVTTDNFLALNTDANDNPVYYGRVFLDSDIGLRGTVDAPRVDVRARLNKGSYLTYVKSPAMLGRAESNGIVEFRDSLYHDAIMTRAADSIDGSSGVRGMDLHATVSFEKSVKLKMFVDPESGDSLYVVGGGTLDFTLDRSGHTTLTGRYRISDGGYHLVINDLVKRNFTIENGSYVYWSGDVLDAYVDLKAVYTIKASPIDLVQNEIGAMTEAERNKYRNLLTFNVYLKMTGFLSAPQISFDIQLAPGDRGALNGAVNGRLAQLREDESLLNKQVFALLTLRRFIGDNPLDNGSGGGGLGSASRSSASKVLTQQLNNLSGRYVTAVDLDLGVNSFDDYSSGQVQGRTQLQVGVSRQLLNDRVRVHVGGNVELEGERARQNNASDVAGNLSVDYKLTQDGRYRLKAFRENQYENPIEGELTKTGMGIIYIRNYNTLRELLRGPERRKTTKTK